MHQMHGNVFHKHTALKFRCMNKALEAGEVGATIIKYSVSQLCRMSIDAKVPTARFSRQEKACDDVPPEEPPRVPRRRLPLAQGTNISTTATERVDHPALKKLADSKGMSHLDSHGGAPEHVGRDAVGVLFVGEAPDLLVVCRRMTTREPGRGEKHTHTHTHTDIHRGRESRSKNDTRRQRRGHPGPTDKSGLDPKLILTGIIGDAVSQSGFGSDEEKPPLPPFHVCIHT